MNRHCSASKFILNLINLILGLMATLMMFAACFSYQYVSDPKSRYLPTLQRLPWLTVYQQVAGMSPVCFGLGLTSFYTGVCGIAPTMVGVYANGYDDGCPAPSLPTQPDAQQFAIDTCNMLNTCVYSGNVVLGFSMFSFVLAACSTYYSWVRFRGGNENSFFRATAFSGACVMFTCVSFFSFYSCGNSFRNVLNEQFTINPTLDANGKPLIYSLTLGAGGGGICALLSWLIFCWATVTNFFMGKDEGNDLNTPLSGAEVKQGGAPQDGLPEAQTGVSVAKKENAV